MPDLFAGHPSLASLGIRERTGANVVGVDRMGVMTANPPPTFELSGGDRLLVIADLEQVRQLSALFAETTPKG